MKKTITILVTVIAFITILMGCSTAPVGCFSTDKGKTPKLNEEIQYDANCSKNADTFVWDFGDGTSGNGIQVKHKYTVTGDYVVKLTASNSSKTVTISQTVTIIP